MGEQSQPPPRSLSARPSIRVRPLRGLISFAASPLHAILYLRASIPRPPPVRPLTPALPPDPFNMRTFILASALLFLLGCSYSAAEDNIQCHQCKSNNKFVPCTDSEDIQKPVDCKGDAFEQGSCVTVQIAGDQFKGCVADWQQIVIDATGNDQFNLGQTGFYLPQCFYLNVATTAYTDPPVNTTPMDPTEAPTTASTTASTAASTTAKPESRWRDQYLDGYVKVDTCQCTTDPAGDSTGCNANGCSSCKACWGGTTDVPDEDQFCQLKSEDFCMEPDQKCSGAASVSFGVATTAATFIASRIFA